MSSCHIWAYVINNKTTSRQWLFTIELQMHSLSTTTPSTPHEPWLWSATARCKGDGGLLSPLSNLHRRSSFQRGALLPRKRAYQAPRNSSKSNLVGQPSPPLLLAPPLQQPHEWQHLEGHLTSLVPLHLQQVASGHSALQMTMLPMLPGRFPWALRALALWLVRSLEPVPWTKTLMTKQRLCLCVG